MYCCSYCLNTVLHKPKSAKKQMLCHAKCIITAYLPDNFHGEEIPLDNQCKYLGIHLDSTLSWYVHASVFALKSTRRHTCFMTERYQVQL